MKRRRQAVSSSVSAAVTLTLSGDSALHMEVAVRMFGF